jgi:uncharacterized protein (TIGR01777 family)
MTVPYHGGRPLTVAISGASGLVGSALASFLVAGRHGVRRVVRGPATRAGDVSWDPAAGRIDAGGLDGVDAVVHLAGENIASGLWTKRKKERIRASRVRGTALIARTLAAAPGSARVLVNASAIGFYGDRGDALLDEACAPGEGFLAETSRAWEAATEPAREAGVRVVRLRIGIVLDGAGGVLPRMALPFRLGLGGRLGSGRQFTSWIALRDLVGVIDHALHDAALEGPVNAVSPNPVRNVELTRALGRVLRRPTLVPVPAPVIRGLLGEMGHELLLASTRVVPRRLARAGFRFHLAELEPALRSILGRCT